MNTTSSAVRPRRLFLASCVSLIATSVTFAVVGAIMLTLKSEFTLTNYEVGLIGGAAIWGFAVSQLLFAPFCDTLGMRFLLRLAFACHLLGAILLMSAGGFLQLFLGALTLALGNGLVEAACNPLVAALYPDEKTVKLNQFHVWFPGGIVIGSVLAFALDSAGLGAWQFKVGLILIPTLIYGHLMLREEFPPTEGVSAGVSMGSMFHASFTPLMILMLFCMAITASTELGPNRWVPPVLEAGGIHGILVLAWINGLMAVLRYKAGFAVERLSPPGVLAASAAISVVGLLWLSYAETTTMAFASATVFAVGVCYFWPTMLGFVSERIPRSGALGLGLMGATGMAVVGLWTTPWMGGIADRVGHERLPVVETRALLSDAAAAFAGFDESAAPDLAAAGEAVGAALTEAGPDGTLPESITANALRAIINSGGDEALVERATALLGPADNYGGRVSFRYIVPFTAALILIFGLLYARDRRAGGYRAVKIGRGPEGG
ncbi:MFS transporter [Candidatus Palauibacter sp.]|uniref:MFS transporter n=1 Tax=Candidatus Palauibacter sp. TaxID=3101350 RepID=UPI003B5957AC